MPNPFDTAAPVTEPATDRQTAFVEKLIREWIELDGRIHGDKGEISETLLAEILAPLRSDRSRCSEAIDRYKVSNQTLRTQLARRPEPVAVEDGFYVVDRKVFKVYHTVHGRNVQVAKLLHPEREGSAADRWEYLGQRGLVGIRPEHKLNRAKATELGKLYGICVRCGATLTDEGSQERAMGPICWAKTSV